MSCLSSKFLFKMIRIIPFFLASPFLSLIYALAKLKGQSLKWVIILVVSFLGYTTTSIGDLERYESRFYSVQDEGLYSLLKSYVTVSIPDLYADLMALIVGGFGGGHHTYFALMFGIFSFLLISAIVDLLKFTNARFYSWGIALILGLCLLYSIRNFYSLRFYTGGIYYLFVMIRYLINGKRVYFFLSFLAPVFHFSLIILSVVSALTILVKNKTLIAALIALASFAVNQQFLIANVSSNYTGALEGTVLEKRYNGYASEEGKEKMDKRYEKRNNSFNWKASSLLLFQNALHGLVVIFVFVYYFIFKLRYGKNYFNGMWSFVFLLLFAVNIMSNVSNGDRFVLLFDFMGYGLLIWVYYFGNATSALSLVTLRMMGVFVLIIGLMQLYAANILFTWDFFVLNYPLAVFNNLFD